MIVWNKGSFIMQDVRRAKYDLVSALIGSVFSLVYGISKYLQPNY